MSGSAPNVFVPYKWQYEPWRDKTGILLLTGAAGGGKSRLAAEKIHALMLKYPGATAIVGRKDRTSAMRSVVPLLLYTVIGDTDWGTYHKSDGVFEYHNGSMIWIAGVRDEGQRENLRSIGKDGAADFAWFEEANKLTQHDDDEIAARMRANAAGWRQRMYTTNPDSPDHWIKRRLIDQKMAHTYYSRPEDNPRNPPDYIRTLQDLTGVSRQRLWEGLWVQAEGAIYTEYDSAIHLRETPPIYPNNGRFIASIDFGFTNPFSCSIWYVSSDGVIYQLGQVYRTQRLVEDHAKDIRAMLARLSIPIARIEAWVCDHDAEDRATLAKHLGITTLAAYKDIRSGIDAVKTRFRDRRLFLYIGAVTDPDVELEKKYKPTSTADEVNGYVWSDKRAETPVMVDDHGLDEMRYLVCYVDQIGSYAARTSSKIRVTNYVHG